MLKRVCPCACKTLKVLSYCVSKGALGTTYGAMLHSVYYL